MRSKTIHCIGFLLYYLCFMVHGEDWSQNYIDIFANIPFNNSLHIVIILNNNNNNSKLQKKVSQKHQDHMKNRNWRHAREIKYDNPWSQLNTTRTSIAHNIVHFLHNSLLWYLTKKNTIINCANIIRDYNWAS